MLIAKCLHFTAGAAALVELLSEPLYILALVQAKIGLRVVIEAAATILKILAILLLLWSGISTEAVALSMAQVRYLHCIHLCFIRFGTLTSPLNSLLMSVCFSS